MTLCRKTLLILGAILLCLLLILYLSSRFILLAGFSEIERDEATGDAQRVLNMVSDDIASLTESTEDWASFGDTYTYLQDGDESYAASHLADRETWLNNDVDAMLFINDSGGVVFQGAFDPERMEFVPVPAGLTSAAAGNSILTEHPEADCALSGIIMLPQGPMMVASVPVMKAGSPEPASGMLVWGRYLDQAVISRIGQMALAQVSLYNIDSGELPADVAAALGRIGPEEAIYTSPLSDTAFGSYSVIDDMNGEPALVLRVETPRDISAQGNKAIRYLLMAITLAGLACGALIMTLIHRQVIRRVKELGSRVRQAASTGDMSLRLEMEGSDELALLASDINRLLSALERSHKGLSRINVELEDRVREKTESLRDKIEVLQELSDIDREIIAASDAAGIQGLICDRVAGIMRAPKVLVVLKDMDGAGRVTSSFGLTSRGHDSEELKTLFESDLFAAVDHPGGAVVCFNEVTAYDSYLPELIAREDAHSLALGSLIIEGRPLGALLVIDTVPREWGEDEIQVLGLLASQLALGINTARLFEEEKATREELASLYRLSRELSDTAPDIDTILSIVSRTAVETINITFCRIALLDNDELLMRSAYPRRVLGQDLRVGYSEPVTGLSYCSRILRQSAPVVLTADRQVLSCHERDVIFMGGAKTVCLVPLVTPEKPLGLLILGEARDEEREPFTPGKLELARNIGDQATSTLRRAELFSQLEQAYMQTVLSLANAVDARDAYTNGHGQVMAHMALAVGRMFNMPPAALESLHFASLLHDVGKIGVADSILQKPAKLTREEWVQMQRHPATGEQILSPLPYLGHASLLVRHHHEHFDGTGYPDMLAGEAIPLGSRILAVVDSYCAMRDKRVYKDPVSHEEAVRELRDCAGTQFDPKVVDTFIRLMESGIINLQNRLGQHLEGKPRNDTEAA